MEYPISILCSSMYDPWLLKLCVMTSQGSEPTGPKFPEAPATGPLAEERILLCFLHHRLSFVRRECSRFLPRSLPQQGRPPHWGPSKVCPLRSERHERLPVCGIVPDPQRSHGTLDVLLCTEWLCDIKCVTI